MSEVKRYDVDGFDSRAVEHQDGNFILASDFDAREKQWKEVVRKLIGWGDYDLESIGKDDWPTMRAKALALLNDQPQEDKSHDAK